MSHATDSERPTTSRNLPFTPPYAHESLLAAFAAHATPGLEVTDPGAKSHSRIVTVGGGAVVATITFNDDHVLLTADTTDAATLDGLAATCRRWLDLDHDPTVIRRAFQDDPRLGPLVRARPGLRVPGTVDGFEQAILTVLGQQVSVTAGRTFGGRLVAAWGQEAQQGFTLFPTPERLAAVPAAELQRTVGLTHARTRTVLTMAETFVGGLILSPDVDTQDARAQLLALPGVGPWTADYLVLRTLGDRDAYPAGDLVLQRALNVSSASEALAAAEGWRPWRSYALFHLWTSTAYL